MTETKDKGYFIWSRPVHEYEFVRPAGFANSSSKPGPFYLRE